MAVLTARSTAPESAVNSKGLCPSELTRSTEVGMPVGPGEASRAEASTMGMVLLVEAERFQTGHRVRAKCLRGMLSMALAFVIGVWNSNPHRHSQDVLLEFAILH